MRWTVATIIFAFIIINLGVAGIMHSDMNGGHSFLCNSPLAGNCQAADNEKSMFASHYLFIIKILSDAATSGVFAVLFSLLIFLIFHLFHLSAAALTPLARIAQKWKHKILPHRLKLLRWIAFHNKGDNAASFGLKNYSYV